MSWIVHKLLASSKILHSEADPNNDDYLDLIMIESAFDTLVKRGVISWYEKTIIDLLRDGNLKRDIARIVGRHRKVVSDDLDSVCKRIAFFLGGYFTDDGYIEYVSEKYKLNDEQIEKLIKFMTSTYKHR